MITTQPNIMWWGWLIMFIALLLIFGKSFVSGSGDGQGSQDQGANQDNNINRENPATPQNPTGRLGPVNFKADECKHHGTSVHLEWNPVEGATGYQIQGHSGRNLHWYSVRPVRTLFKQTTPNTNIDFNNTSVRNRIKPNQTYTFRARAIAAGKKGPWSFIEIYPQNSPLVRPTLHPINLNATGFHLTWDGVSNADRYHVERSHLIMGGWSGWSRINTTTHTNFDDPINNAMLGTIFRFKIQAESDTTGASPYSNIQSRVVYSGTTAVDTTTDANGNLIVTAHRTY